MPTTHDRIFGCLLAGAVGDSIGARFENQTSPVFAVPEYLRVTDDTQLTLATSEAIIQQKGVEAEAIANRMADWFRHRRISGIGSSTLKALTELAAGGHWAMVGASGERSAGNGAAMRIAPLAFFLDPDSEMDRRTVRDVSRITHRNDEAYLGALAIVRAMRAQQLVRGLITELIEKLPDCRVRDRFVEIDRDGLDVKELAGRYKPSGYVVDSVLFAILAAIEAEDFMGTVQKIVECGGDTDTTASMCGQLIGSHRGQEIVPTEIAVKLNEYEAIVDAAEKLSVVVETC